MRLFAALLLLLTVPVRPAVAQSGIFDYFVVALSWSPTFCALGGDAEGNPQCAKGSRNGFLLNGLLPQFSDNWPDSCPSDKADPSQKGAEAMADIMGTPDQALYQWTKHGRCTGLSADEYLTASRKAFQTVRIPDVFRDLKKDVELPVSAVEEAFIESNPGMIANGITVSCDEDRISVVRICLTKDLTLRECGEDIQRDCRMLDALMEAP